MARGKRVTAGGLVYHVLNRGNDKATVFHKPSDFQAFEKLMVEAKARVPMRVLGYCLMSNHWHLVLWPEEDGQLSAFVGWLTNTHAHRYREHYHDVGHGHVYQSRFRSFPIQTETRLLMPLRYVEANPLRARLSTRAGGWPWCSFARREAGDKEQLLDPWPVERPPQWDKIVEALWAEADLAEMRQSLERGRPLGDDDWVRQTAAALGLCHTLRPRGRPRKGPAAATPGEANAGPSGRRPGQNPPAAEPVAPPISENPRRGRATAKKPVKAGEGAGPADFG